MSQGTDDFAQAAQDLAEAMRGTTTDPADAIRILTGLARAPVEANDSLSQAAADVIRRAALNSMAQACADYQPVSSADARAVTEHVAGLLDAEMLAAADAGQLASYTALSKLREAVVADLSARSAALPDLVTVTIPGAMPSLALAYRLYGDAGREPEMTARSGAVHPGFMPPSFEALSS